MKTIIIGPRGKMGKVITAAAYEDERLRIVASVGPAGRDYIGRDTGLVAGLGVEIGAPVTDKLESVIDACDVIIDFSTKELSLRVIEAAKRHGKALVCGTTGFAPSDLAAFDGAATVIPVIHAANTSRVVGCMSELLKICARTFGSEADIEIIEMHDRNKVDAPSGTSKELGAIMAEAMGGDIGELAVYGRQGTGTRKEGSIGYHSVRSGSLPSSHVVMFGFMGERLEIAHHTYNWECFARGACDAAFYLRGKPAGLYTMKDVLGV